MSKPIPVITPATKTIALINAIADGKHPQKYANQVLGAYVGNYVQGKADTSEAILRLLEAAPHLRKTANYTKISTFDPAKFPVEPGGEETPIEKQGGGYSPGVDTERVNDVSDDIIFDCPMAVSVAKKTIQLYNSAKRRNIEYDLTPADVEELLTAEACYFTGEPMSTSGLNQRTVDRLDSKKGYVTGNVVACTYQANQLKNYLFENTESELFMSPKTLMKFMFVFKNIGD